MSDSADSDVMKPNMAMMRGPFTTLGILTFLIVMMLIMLYVKIDLSVERCLNFEGACMKMGLIIGFFVFCLGHVYIRSAITLSTMISDDGVSYFSCCGASELKFSEVNKIRILKGLYTGLVIEIIAKPKKIRFSLGLFDDERLMKLLETKIADDVPGKEELLKELSAYREAKKSA
jgi:hypothetical protein